MSTDPNVHYTSDFPYLENPETLTAQLQLYCDDRKEDRTLIQTAQGIGMVLAIFFSYFIDRFGKKYIFCASIMLLVLACICNLTEIYSSVLGGIFQQYNPPFLGRFNNWDNSQNPILLL
jgi:MFS family permease